MSYFSPITSSSANTPPQGSRSESNRESRTRICSFLFASIWAATAGAAMAQALNPNVSWPIAMTLPLPILSLLIPDCSRDDRSLKKRVSSCVRSIFTFWGAGLLIAFGLGVASSALSMFYAFPSPSNSTNLATTGLTAGLSQPSLFPPHFGLVSSELEVDSFQFGPYLNGASLNSTRLVLLFGSYLKAARLAVLCDSCLNSTNLALLLTQGGLLGVHFLSAYAKSIYSKQNVSDHERHESTEEIEEVNPDINNVSEEYKEFISQADDLKERNAKIEKAFEKLKVLIENDSELKQSFTSSYEATRQILLPPVEMDNSPPVDDPILEECRKQTQLNIYYRWLIYYSKRFLELNPKFLALLQTKIDQKEIALLTGESTC